MDSSAIVFQRLGSLRLELLLFGMPAKNQVIYLSKQAALFCRKYRRLRGRRVCHEYVVGFDVRSDWGDNVPV